MAKGKRTKGQTTIYNTPHRKLKIEKHEPVTYSASEHTFVADYVNLVFCPAVSVVQFIFCIFIRLWLKVYCSLALILSLQQTDTTKYALYQV